VSRIFFSIRVFTTVFIAYHKMVISDHFTHNTKTPYVISINTFHGVIPSGGMCVLTLFFGSVLFSNIIELTVATYTFEFSCLRHYNNISPTAPFKIFSGRRRNYVNPTGSHIINCRRWLSFRLHTTCHTQYQTDVIVIQELCHRVWLR